MMGISVFVNGRERPVVMQDMQRRIERGDIEAERGEAIQVCCSSVCVSGYGSWLMGWRRPCAI
jgi:hypothetical protein